MKTSPTRGSDPWLAIRLLRHGPGFLRVFARLFRDPRTPLLARAVPVLMLAWFVSPLDLDWVPFLGWVDDVAVLIFGARLFISLCPDEVVAEHVDAVGRGL